MLTLECTQKRVTIEATQPIGIDEPIVQALVSSAVRFHQSVPLVEIRMRLIEPNKYRYTFEAADGRKWRQDFRFQNGDVYQTFTVSDEWTEREYEPHRAVRGGCIQLAKQFGASDVRIVWL